LCGHARLAVLPSRFCPPRFGERTRGVAAVVEQAPGHAQLALRWVTLPQPEVTLPFRSRQDVAQSREGLGGEGVLEPREGGLPGQVVERMPQTRDRTTSRKLCTVRSGSLG